MILTGFFLHTCGQSLFLKCGLAFTHLCVNIFGLLSCDQFDIVFVGLVVSCCPAMIVYFYVDIS